MEIRIREHRLPGVGHRYELGLPGDRRLIVVVQDRGRRDLGLVSGAADVPDVMVSLTPDQAVAVAALLTGARFSIGSTGGDPVVAGDVAIETVTLLASSPAVGRRTAEIHPFQHGEATVLAVIRDDTPELIEHQDARPCQPGDRLVIAARRDRINAVMEQLAG